MANLRVHFVTNRNYLPDNKKAVFGGQFNPDGVAALRFGHATYSLAGGKLSSPEVFVYPDIKLDPATGKPPPSTTKGSPGFLDDLRVAMKDGCTDTLVYIHGFNVTFLEALKAGATIASQIEIGGKPINIVVFSWPSDGTAVPFMSYYSDREDARVCGPAMARTYLKLLDFLIDLKPGDYCDRSLHLLAHSMGNYVLRHGLQALCAKDRNRVVRVFNEIILAAPDEDEDAFEHDEKLKFLPSLGHRVTVYHNARDRALLVSDKTKANPDRLGSGGPRMLDMLPRKVAIVDCSRVAPTGGDKLSEHSYYINCPLVTSDLLATLQGELPEMMNRDVIRTDRAYRIRRLP